MKKLILFIGLLLITTFSFAQKIKVDVVKYKFMTTAERDALVVPANETWKIWNNTNLRWEYWDGDSWEPFPKELIDLTDVSDATPTSGFALMGNGVDFAARLLTEADISDLTHFTPTDLLTDYNFTDNSVNWNLAYTWGDHSTFNYSTGAHIQFAWQLDDVQYESLNVGELLQWNGSNWVNKTFSELDIFTGAHTVVDDSAYSVAWDGNLDGATKNALYDKIETIIAGGGSTLTQEEVEDYVGNMTTGSATESLISVVYQDNGVGVGVLDHIVNPDLSLYNNATSGFISSEVDGSTTNELQTLDVASLVGTELRLSLSSDGEATKVIELGGLGGGGGTDDQTLDEVLTQGQTSSQYIGLTNGATYYAWSGIVSSNPRSYFDSNQMVVQNGNAFTRQNFDSFEIYNGTFSAFIKNTNGTTPNTFELPNISTGTFALEANAAGFNGNLANTDNTLQEIAQKLDDLVVGGSADDTPYSVSWNGDTTTAASKNAIYDKIEQVVAGGGGASQLSDLSDVNTSTATNRNVLVADGVDFESRQLVEADISDLSHTTDTTLDEASVDAFVANNGYVVQSDAQFSGTGTAISLDDNVRGKLYNVTTPSGATAYTTNSPLRGGYAQAFINSATEPTVDGSTALTGGNVFEANVDMVMVIYTVDGSNVNHYFVHQGIPVASGGGGTISDAVYGVSWDGNLDGASKNAIYDKLETIAGGTESTSVSDTAEIDLTLTGTDIKADIKTGSIDETKLDVSTNASLDLADSALQSEVDGSVTNELQAFDIVQLVGTQLQLSLVGDGVATETVELGSIADDDDGVPEVYGVGWNGDNEAATKNDVYDKIETVVAGGGESTTVSDTAEINMTLTSTDISATIFTGSIDETKLDASTNVSLDKADTALQNQADVEGLGFVTGAHTVDDDDGVAEVYGVGWSGDGQAPTKNDLYNKIESISGGATNLSTSTNGNSVTVQSDTGTNAVISEATGGAAGVLSITRLNQIIANNAKVSDDDLGVTGVYGVAWNGSNDSPTKNDVYDKIETIAGGSESTSVGDTAEIDLTLTGTQISADIITGSIDVLKLDSGVQSSLALADTALQSEQTNLSQIANATTVIVQSSTGTDASLTGASALVAGILTASDWNSIQANNLKVTDDDDGVAEVYGVGWNGDIQSPTKNDVYDKIESLSVGGGDVSKVGTPLNNQLGVWTGDGTIEGEANLSFEAGEFLMNGTDFYLFADTPTNTTGFYTSNVGTGDMKFTQVSPLETWSFGFDNSTANDDWVLSNNNVLGTNNVFSVDGLTNKTTFEVELTTSGTPINTGTSIKINNNITGLIYNVNSPLATLTYNVTDYITGGYSQVYVNAPSEPNVLSKYTLSASSLVIGEKYTIKTVGTTDFTTVGASANTVGVVFVATGATTGTGVVDVNSIQTGGNPFVQDSDMTLVVYSPNGTDTKHYWVNQEAPITGAGTAVSGNKAITIESPTSSEDITLFYTNKDIGLDKFVTVLQGSSTPSISYNVHYSTDRSAVGNKTMTLSKTTTSTTLGDAEANSNYGGTIMKGTIPAGNWIWIETTAQSGTVDAFHLTIHYHER